MLVNMLVMGMLLTYQFSMAVYLFLTFYVFYSIDWKHKIKNVLVMLIYLSGLCLAYGYFPSSHTAESNHEEIALHHVLIDYLREEFYIGSKKIFFLSVMIPANLMIFISVL
jgi:hypothetical protein